jgi:hypothetical protein
VQAYIPQVTTEAPDFAALAELDRGRLVAEPDLSYDGATPVRVRVAKRGGRYTLSDDGLAVDTAGVEPGELSFPDRIRLGEYAVNVSRQGVVWLPAFAHQGVEWLERASALVARGSVVLYESLLNLDD